MLDLTEDVKNHQREIKTVKMSIMNIEKNIKDGEKKFEGNVRSAMASEMHALADRVEAVEKMTSRPGGIGATVPPPSASSSATSQIGPAGCEVVADVIIDYVKETLKGTILPGLLDVYAPLRRPRVCHLRFASTSEMFQGLRSLRKASLSSELYDNLWVGIGKPI